MVDTRGQGGEEQDKAPYPAKSTIASREEEVLAFWQKQKIFEKSLKKPSPKGDFVFYDGPPFATGLPHFGNLLQSAIKDAVPRYRTMSGYHVPRRWGWDCHGLPLENQIEQELGLKTKRDIEQLGIEKFNTAAKNAVLRYSDDWEKIIERFGRWADMRNAYSTMDASYTESVWWAFKNLYDRGLIYEGFKAMHLCPRCGTTLSNFEVAQGYKDIDDWAVTIKLPLVDEKDTSLLIWTTTPWTLPGNAAAAVNADATYVKVKVADEFVVVAKELLSKLFSSANDFEIVSEFKGKELVGKKYEPPFNYFKDQLHKHKTHAFKVYAAPYVTMEDGTGVVHLAPAYGADDLALAQKEKIPLIHHVTDEGKFVATVADFAHMPVKPKGRHMETDVKIIENLKSRRLLFAQEKIKHSYPHCWRCDTPLLNWAANSWFVNVQKVKSKLVSQNKNVTWVPAHVGTGRFNNLLEGAPDWAISRSRYWGAPLPVWRHTKTKEIKVAGSVEELLSMVKKSNNRYFVMRHGQARSNVEGFMHDNDDLPNHLTDTGKEQVRLSAQKLKNTAHIDLIVSSPLARAQETAGIAQHTLGLPDSVRMTDERLRETGVGVFNGKTVDEWKAFFGSRAMRFTRAPDGGETYVDIRRRVGEFLFEIEKRYTGKNILIVTHGDPAWFMHEVSVHTPHQEIVASPVKRVYPNNAEYHELFFTAFPHNENYELDLHRPYIDEVKFGNSLSGEWKRVHDVFDCWFESGSMPYASNHYPFENKENFNPKRFFGLMPKGYPAHFIAEGLDQTRGWFYSLIVLGTALFAKTPYKAVITNGLILAEDGRKMSKKLKNYPDPMELVEKFGADALRYYMLSSAVIRGEDLRFSARGVEEVAKKLLMRLDNVRSFYDLYKNDTPRSAESSNVLDRWILSRLGELIQETTEGFEKYELDVATRPLLAFIDDLSTWYLRRSRDRFKTDGEGKTQALATIRFVLFTLAHAMAPVLPFFAEYLYGAMKEEGDSESVHLCDWPSVASVDTQLLLEMKQIRELASKGLELRERENIKIRQPLAKISAKTIPQDPALRALIAEEVNVKEVTQDLNLDEEVVLDTALTPELREEGMVRDIARKIQDWRKEQKLTISDRPALTLSVTSEEKVVAEKNRETLMKQTGLKELHLVIKKDA